MHHSAAKKGWITRGKAKVTRESKKIRKADVKQKIEKQKQKVSRSSLSRKRKRASSKSYVGPAKAANSSTIATFTSRKRKSKANLEDCPPGKREKK